MIDTNARRVVRNLSVGSKSRLFRMFQKILQKILHCASLIVARGSAGWESGKVVRGG